jgi:hypothetical protein
MRLAAERDIVPITSGFMGAKGIRDAATIWAHTRRELAKPITGLEIGLQAMSHVTDTEQEARAELGYARWQIRANRALQRQDVVDGGVQATPYEGEPDDETFWNTVYYGTPDALIARFRTMAAAGVTFVSNWMMHGGMEHAKIMRSIRLLGEEVIPALRDVHPPDRLTEELLATGDTPVPLPTGPAPAQ